MWNLMSKSLLMVSLIFLFLHQGQAFSDNSDLNKEAVSKPELKIKPSKRGKIIRKSDVKNSANVWIGRFNVPTGSILPWVPNQKNPQELNEKTNIPRGFIICDGPHKEDDPNTQFDERKIPKINKEDIFKGDEKGSVILLIKVDY